MKKASKKPVKKMARKSVKDMLVQEQPKDMFATRWVVFGVVLLSLLMPLGCGVKGDLKRKPAEKPAAMKVEQPKAAQ